MSWAASRDGGPPARLPASHAWARSAELERVQRTSEGVRLDQAASRLRFCWSQRCAGATRRSFSVSAPVGGRFDRNSSTGSNEEAQVRCTRSKFGDVRAGALGARVRIPSGAPNLPRIPSGAPNLPQSCEHPATSNAAGQRPGDPSARASWQGPPRWLSRCTVTGQRASCLSPSARRRCGHVMGAGAGRRSSAGR